MRITALKRYVKKGYNVEKMLDLLDKNGLKISRSQLYKNEDYCWVIKKISEEFEEAGIKSRKFNNQKKSYLRPEDVQIYSKSKL